MTAHVTANKMSLGSPETCDVNMESQAQKIVGNHWTTVLYTQFSGDVKQILLYGTNTNHKGGAVDRIWEPLV